MLVILSSKQAMALKRSSQSLIDIFTKIKNSSKNIALTFSRDLRGIQILVSLQTNAWKMKTLNATVVTRFNHVVSANKNKPAIICQDKVWTFQDLDSFSNKIAQTFVSSGYKPGDEVALLMDNKPEFVGIWLGAAKAGLITALLNTNLKSSTLLHSLSVIQTRALIYDSVFEPVVQDLQKILPSDKTIQFYRYDENGKKVDEKNTKAKSLIPLIEASADRPVNFRGNFTDKLLYIYTSGTTGLPKAAIITNARFFIFGHGIKTFTRLTSKDIVYTPLPLYHSAGGILGASNCLLYSTTIVIRNKFSAKHFWEDCYKYKCTMAQYIGETVRYLLATPQNEYDRKHSVRCVYGNGFRPSLWREFKERFGVGTIVELYGATEGSARTVNIDNYEGSCGFIPKLMPTWLLKRAYQTMLIRIHQETGEPIRNEKGFCEICEPGEVGQIIGMISNKNVLKGFEGYADKEATRSKILKDVFRKGDSYYASGDLLVRDELGYLYFVDRTGDTYRWKGENVSTGEVEAVIGSITNHADTVVYGVLVPGNEGRAGMVAIRDTTGSLDLKDLLIKMKKELPQYAIPIFIRLTADIEVTSTFKMPKFTLKKESYDINLVNDPIYVLDWKNEEYKKLDKETYDKIINGEYKF
ncbi:long-chain fatty acid transport protein 4-like [Tetranychus urticae]|uniref:Very long-chain fatty acid transport protein n=1 Tax=Tetranychus urticae TaxID=32264 RepID=T1KB75_TETUR|nr:long-chain fatty acid transport protein 4-like [Tetranychus urticae]